MPGIFISYRNVNRSYAPVLIDRELRRRFGSDNVFQASRSNLPATAFPQEIMRSLRECTLLIALIDPPWAGEDLALLRNSTDWVRREISYALKHRKEILPVLLDGAQMPGTRELPGQLAPMTHRIALRMTARSADTDLVRLIGEVERLVPELVLATLTDPPPPAPVNPAALLRPEYEAVPFRPRPELDELTAWCADPAGPLVRLVTGPAGAGKTRLGLRLCTRLRGAGWAAGLLSASAAAPALGLLGEASAPCLVVIDDAETRIDQVCAAVGSLAMRPGSAGRLLLLARSASTWLARIQEHSDDRVSALADGVVPLRLEPLVAEGEDFGAVRAGFARRLGLAVPTPTAHPVVGSMLELQAAVLASLLPPDRVARPPLHRILDLERDYWSRVAAATGLAHLTRHDLAEIMTAVTLFGAGSEPEADALIASLRAFRGGTAGAGDSCRDLLRTVLPGPSPLNPLQPEQLAEDAVADFLRSGQSLSDSVPAVTDQQALRALIALGRCLDRHPDVGGQVAAFLGAEPRRLLPLAMIALASVPRPELLAEQMRLALENVPADDLASLVAALPQRSEALADLAVVLTESALLAARASGPGDLATARLARLLATRLAYLGERPSDAARYAREAVAQLTMLAGTSDELSAELAEAHAALALALDLDPAARPGALDAGAAAIAGYRSLRPAARRDGALATALNNQSARLKRAGEVGPALTLAAEGSRLTAPLHDERPHRFRSLHADIADSLAVLTELAGQPAEAERVGRGALALRRALAAARPDAYRPQLAGTLYNLGLILSGHSGDPAEIRTLWTESAAILDDLAAGRPGRFDEMRDRVRRHLSALEAGDD